MSDWGKCSTCGEYGWLASHKCAPIWEARLFETKWDEEWREVHGRDQEEAAAKFCEDYDRDGDYDIIRRGSAEVQVRKPGEEDIVLVDVSAESVPEYSAWIRSPPGHPT